MTICEYCIKTLFKEPFWKPRQKGHHTKVEEWQESIKQCTICSCLLDAIKNALLKKMEGDISNVLDTYLRFESVLNAGVLALLRNALPVYSVTLQESAARDQFVLIFQPVEGILQKIDIPGPFGNVEGLVLPVRRFQVYSTVYDDEEIPRLSNETFLEDRENPRNKRTLDQVKGWIRECNEQHKYCGHFAKQEGGTTTGGKRNERKNFVPTRLIEVSPRDLEQNHVRLVETDGQDEFRCYASLSHCWGGFITVCTYDYNYKEHKKSIPLTAKFPRNFFNAIELCRELGIGYIWIDSLCIIQGSKADWVKEAPRMHEVYGSSFLNIAATSARNSTEGLHRKRRINLLSPSIVPCDWQGRHRYCKVIREDFWSGELLAEPLYKRAWVTQERMLAPRTLNFGSKQLFWQCLTNAACETMPKGIPAVIRSAGREELQWRRLLQQSRDDKARNPGDHLEAKSKVPGEVSNNDKIELQDVWRDAVQNYTSCNITNTGDKLPAVAGLAQVMHDCCQEEYVAGLWGSGDGLVVQLAWRVKDCRNVEGQPARRQLKDEYRAPTWAWPSVVDGVIEIPRRVKVGLDTIVSLEIREKHLKYAEEKGSNGWNFMSLSGGWLDVTGFLYILRFYDAKDPETPYWCWELNGVAEEEKPWVYMFPDEPLSSSDAQNDVKTDGANPTARDFIILPLFYSREPHSGRALVIKEETDSTRYKYTPKTKNPAAIFTRIGMVEFREVHGDLWERFTRQAYEVRNGQRGGDGQVGMFLL